MQVIELLLSDYKKYKKYGGNFISILFFTQGFWAVLQYRLAHSVYKMKVPLVKQVLQIICLIWQKNIEIVTGISIPSSVSIGHSFYIGHFGGIILNAKTIIGNNCNLSQGVTIGVSGLADKRGVPILKNNVYIGANAVLVGKIIIEDNVLVGACSLVNSSAEKNAVLLGVPAIKVSDKGSEGYI